MQHPLVTYMLPDRTQGMLSLPHYGPENGDTNPVGSTQRHQVCWWQSWKENLSLRHWRERMREAVCQASHTHKNGGLLLIPSVLWHCKYLQIYSNSHNFIKQIISGEWQFLYKETYSPSNPTRCPDTSDVIQGRGSEEHLVKRDDSVEFCKTRAGRAKYIFEGIPLKLETEGRQHNDANKITLGINLAWDQLHLPLQLLHFNPWTG